MIDIPSNCPCCNSLLERVKDQLFCRNSDCSAKNGKMVEKYATKMKIKGLGPASIAKLELQTIGDIYDLTEEILEDELGKNGLKIFLEIQNKRKIKLSQFLGASSIPLVGETTAEKISTELSQITKESLMKDGFGDKASTNLINWLKVTPIPDDITFLGVKKKPELTGIKVCVSGRTPGYTKATLANYLADYNISVVPTVNKDIKYLISETKTSAKAKKAEALNIEIISIDKLKGII